jgi:hypothetical protein
MLHKYGFHLVLSGDRYKKCDQVLILFTHKSDYSKLHDAASEDICRFLL